ncbi:MAG TPA: SlyX family protein [Polyangiaceae bacterium]|nr:SlyX family protein [Polyangiaceae bacterium]
MEQRLVDLEVRYTHLERLVEDLNRVVFTQQQTIDRLTKQLAELVTRSDVATPAAEKPPHY